MRWQVRPIRRIWLVVSKLVVLHDVPDYIDAEAIDAAVQPESQHIEHGFLNFGVPPIEIRLLFQKRVIIVLAGALVELPRAASEVAEPIIRWSSARRRIAPNIPIALGAIA